MASDGEILELVRYVRDTANTMKSTNGQTYQLATKNDSLAIDWNNLATSNPDVLDENGLLVGYNFTPADVSNFLGSLAQFLNYYNGSAVAAGAHGSNAEQLSLPIVQTTVRRDI